MSYQVLALKYRPQTFDEVVGQNHVTTTLANAISQDRMAHALLLTGPRGTGKTTLARILAKAMNCRQGPIPRPCNTCKICTDIIDGHCTDVFEIDGASNNSVDQIRDLRENVTYMPSSAKYKIYIIDEVHMLSTAAFNALLKTLEEPPEHVMFIFATTEVHKIPVTILSRCQRHDLGRISLEMISDHLQHLCKSEGFCIEKQSLDLIAQEADGSIRDALSLLDRLLSSAGTKKIEPESVLNGLGIQNLQIMHDISAAIFENNGAELIEIIEKANESGIDLKKFYSDIILHFRNLNVIKICGKDSPAVNITNSEKEKILQTVSALSDNFINTILQILLDEESIVKYSSHTKTAIEMILLKLLQLNPGAQIDTIISKLNTLANQIGSNQTNLDQTHLKLPSPVQAQERDKNSKTKTWQGFLNKIKQTLPSMYSLLSKGVIKENGQNKINVELKECTSFDNKRLKNKKRVLQKSCKDFLEKELTITIVSKKNMSAQNDSKEKEKRQTAFNHPLVLEAKKIFNGNIIN